MKALQKIDKFYVVFILSMVVMGIFLIYTFRSIFTSVTTSGDVETKVTEAELRIDREKLGNVLKSYNERKIVPLEIR
ncbi:hypothetical protein A3A76_04240 [Candidatus Woesebacteria bacterium RIFCSPLOWO2_01_FULL_39_23]|uniref:Uncharacterized protein n=1 Tax=Candidatus Woesebacteria bacterium RIFCSPHIGHO2_01_FULL_40_22 TaxID=1802499 RepID=A0A1F7YFA4_9BACT|nr:MAG: hypothetical protein A2141_01805 [Candidatus Woesebacteria bacterium RBG_16_40_11]OGM25962.1 MAG: hypothetical protein A2628_00240 [Candidatus Woesebacteria bacterium RIFCSPHIGHO2_01_FULL_40_22]OGM38075.1 MAG: hypothetical protein A3E41_03330 [Candidatus Woesebacteria bacterium RIFCSPHIGHO2_12_FULL_38_9]OGM61811.1 MAG: hypothetical protein A3A76_04240 [Candidatus Woesebacteria bacterium RIFCSPLOWO2_01_FULL_39_23]